MSKKQISSQIKAEVAQEMKNRGYEVPEETLLKGIEEYGQHAHFNKLEVEGSKEAIATYIENAFFVENPIGDTDWCYDNPEREEIIAVYYNPNSIAGGQLVENHISYALIMDAHKRADTEDAFLDILASESTQYLIDIDTPEFKRAVEEYRGRPSEFMPTREALVAIASKNTAENKEDL